VFVVRSFIVAFIAFHKFVEYAGEVLENVALNVALSILFFEQSRDCISGQIGLRLYRAFSGRVDSKGLHVGSF
jgi:hypothetical protein